MAKKQSSKPKNLRELDEKLDEVVEADVAVEEKPVEKPKPKAKPKVEEKTTVTLEATVNTRLSDGTFVQKGSRVEVESGYYERMKRENNKTLKRV